MKISKVGIVAAAILMVAGFGIAQAGGTHSESPVSCLEGQEATQVAKSPQESVPEGNWSGTDWQDRGPIGTGNLSEMGDANDPDHSDVPMEGNIHQYWGSDNPSN